jgi:hypothetical protein
MPSPCPTGRRAAGNPLRPAHRSQRRAHRWPDQGTTTLILGTTPIELPEPVGRLVRHSSPPRTAEPRWPPPTPGACSPAGRPGRPVTAQRLRTRLTSSASTPDQLGKPCCSSSPENSRPPSSPTCSPSTPAPRSVGCEPQPATGSAYAVRRASLAYAASDKLCHFWQAIPGRRLMS